MPTSAHKPCQHTGCANTTHKRYCDKHNKDHKTTHKWGSDKIRGNRHQRGYGSAWDKIRLIILKRDNYLCQTCSRSGRLSAGNTVDHIISKANGGTDEHNNLETICKPCHALKTRQEQSNTSSKVNQLE